MAQNINEGELRMVDWAFDRGSALALRRCTSVTHSLEDSVTRKAERDGQCGTLVGNSRPMQDLFEDINKLARTELTVLIEGETGTGKELVAEAIHDRSQRREKRLVVFDCSAVAPSLVESELFGHERGAFTGAFTAHQGLFEQADGSTLFIDELGELPRELQAKLLGAIERREIRRIGAARARRVDVRVVAATNRNLRSEVESGRFRSDLYFRLNAAQVNIPPLRERMEDLPALVDHFAAQVGDMPMFVPPELWAMFRAHHWPGNVRELRNAVTRFAIMPERVLREGYGWGNRESRQSFQDKPLKEARSSTLAQFERDYIASLLARSDGNITHAAACAGVTRQMVQKMVRKYDLA